MTEPQHPTWDSNMTVKPFTCTIYEDHKFSEGGAGWIESSKWHISFGSMACGSGVMYEVTSKKLYELLRHDVVKTLHERLCREYPDRSIGDLYHDGVINMGQLSELLAYIIAMEEEE
jgi:hypothetical protein